MDTLEQTAPAFVEMAHSIVWATVATVDAKNRPRSRVLHPFWEWEDGKLTGWVATAYTPLKKAHLAHSEYVSLNYWCPEQDTCVAECRASWHHDAETRHRIWNTYLELPPPLGYDPAMIPGWDSPDTEGYAVLRFDPWHIRVFPGSVLMGQGGEVLTWSEA